MRKKAILNLLVFTLLAATLAAPAPVSAEGGTLQKIEVRRGLGNGPDTTVVVYLNGSWVNRTVYVNHDSAPRHTLYASGGTAPWYFQLLNTGGCDARSTSYTPSAALYCFGDVHKNYYAHVDGDWAGGDPGERYYIRKVYPDLIASSPSPDSAQPYCVGEIVDWSTRVTNQGGSPADSTYVGYYLGTSGSDFSNRWDDDGTGTLAADGGYSDESQDYTFQPGDVGTRYLNVMADWEDDEPEGDNENNNTNSYGPFTVMAAPVAAFTGNPRSGPPGTSVAFTDQSTGNPTSWYWQFGDGGTSELRNPTHPYSTTGCHTVRLTVTNSCDQDLEEKQDYICIDDPVDAQFSGAPRSGERTLTVDFTDESTGPVSSWSWSFGDGDTSTAPSPSHPYDTADDYTVSLTVTGPSNSDTETKTNYIHVDDPVVAQFSGEPQECERPLTVNFTDQSTGPVQSWSWTFGDGGTSTAPDPSHEYTAAGEYTVSLTATGPHGSDTETKPNYISVHDPVDAQFSGAPRDGAWPLDVNFTDESTGPVASWSWTFGDGGTSTAKDPSHQYGAEGQYTVSLVVTGPCGTDTETKPNYIDVGPQVHPVISDVKVTNLRDTSFVVSWLTDVNSDGTVNYGSSSALGSSADDDRGAGHADDTHYVTIQNLDPGQTYYFDVTSGLTTDNNGGAHYQVTTGPTLALPASDTAYGQVFLSDGTTPAEGTIVYMTLQDHNGSGTSGSSADLSALVNDAGYWNTNLGNARLPDLTGYFDYSLSGDGLALHAQGAGEGEACSIVDTGSDAPAASMQLGAGCGSSIEVCKDVVPNDSSVWDFALGGPTPGNVDNLGDGQCQTLSVLAAGSYTLSEATQAGYATTVDCGAKGSDNDHNITFRLNSGEHVTCTFTNTKLGSIEVCKEVVPDDSSVWDFTLSGPTPGSVDDLGDGQCQTLSDLAAGSYTLSEATQAGYATTVDCGPKGSDSDHNITFALNSGEHVVCTFTNTKLGTIIVEKQTVPDGAPDSFTFTGDAADTISDGQQIVVSDLEADTYTSVETVPSGWELTSIQCDDANSSGNVGTRTATFQLEAGETVKCTFTNCVVCSRYDFNCDCVIDVVDIMAVASLWRCRCGDECYDHLYDLDDDCDVDIVDIMEVASRWGCQCGDDCYDGPVSQATGQAESRPLSGAAVLSVEPPSSLLGSSETFTVAVNVERAVDLGGFQFAMSFDPAVIRVDNVTLGNFLGSLGRNTAPLGPEINNDTGLITFGGFSFGSQPGASGDGVLAILTLTAQGTGSSPLALENAQVTDTGGQTRTVTVEEGRVMVGVPRRIYLPLIGER